MIALMAEAKQTKARPRLPVPGAQHPAVPADERMLQLIAAAEDVFLAKGYHTATMSDVARAAGMSKKTVYTMIESKAELFSVLLGHYHSLLVFPTPKADWTAQDILVENLLCLARFLLAPKQIALIRLIMAEYTHSPDLGRMYLRTHVNKSKNRMEACLAEIGAAHGCEADFKEVSAMLFGMAIGEFHLGTLIGFRNPPTRAALEKRVRQAVEVFLAGVERWGCAEE
jgi:AcrR family transcriptional regulator